ncbi:MAG: hypothetical protein IPJ03_13480 [Ignavibacteriales bacterium]|nr:hypothetical protein [Ignavibacteriales bacterium]
MKIKNNRPLVNIYSFTISLFVILISLTVKPQTKETDHDVFVISNITDVTDIDSFLLKLKTVLAEQDKKFSVIINGDLVNSDFEKDYATQSARVKYFLTELSKYDKGQFILVPGDRDWDNSGKNGLKNVKKLEYLVKSLKLKNIKWAIKDGCPGPNEFFLDENLLLITINTQWWNHPFEVPEPIDGDCKVSTTEDFKEEMEDIIAENVGKNILIAGHFPIISNGEYGGHFSLRQNLFPLTDIVDGLYLPLPFIGSFYPSFRSNIGTVEDISNERYEVIKKIMTNLISDNNSLIYLSGHDKTQLISELDGNYFVNSGAPESAEYSARIENSVLSESKAGIIQLTYHSDGKVTSIFHHFVSAKKTEKEQFTLLESACVYPENDLPVNYAYIPCFNLESVIKQPFNEINGKVSVVAGPEYEAGYFKRFLLGNHYRDAWTKEIEVPYLNLDTTKGGLTLLRKGGGRQTLSLKFKGADGLRYTFRSVNKDPIKALDYELRKTIIANIVRDQTTTQHPYGALAADILLNELGIIHAHPKLFVMPDDPKLGIYQNEFGGLVGMLEEDPENPNDGNKGFLGAEKILRSNKLFRQLYKDHDNQVNAKNFAVARAFDILVGDWGKHDDNWKWIGFAQDNKTIFEPMPRDRDHVFSRWDGVLPWLADREWAKESGEDFDYEISGLRSLMFQARHLDRFIASNLSKQDWLEAAHFVQNKITDSVIENAVRSMPSEVYENSGKEIKEKLIVRIKDLDKYVLEYYEMISDQVDVVGSNKREYFDVFIDNDGSILVKGYDIINNNRGNFNFYSRKFVEDETSDVRIYGLGGDDVFNVYGNQNSSIKLRIISGSGADSINNQSRQEILVYDKGEKTEITQKDKLNLIESYNESLYTYERTKFEYNTYFPLPYFYYGADDGFIFNFGIDFINHSFDKTDYSNKQHFQISASTSGSFGLEYKGIFHHVVGGWDFLIGGHYDNPLLYSYFYGFGNETVKDDDKYLQNFYRTRFRSKGVSLGLNYNYWKKSSFSLSLRYDNNERVEDIENTIF